MDFYFGSQGQINTMPDIFPEMTARNAERIRVRNEELRAAMEHREERGREILFADNFRLEELPIYRVNYMEADP